MRTLTVYILLFFVIAILSSCSSQDGGLEIVDLNDRSNGRVLELSELMENYRLVELETSERSLVPRYYQEFIGEKFILIISDNEILQFNSEGRFIKSIGKKGKGPGEFSGISDYVVNQDESKLYTYFNRKSDQLLGFDLNSGEELPTIHLPFKGIGDFILTKDYFLILGKRNSTVEMYTLSFDGELIEKLDITGQARTVGYSGRGEYLKSVDENVYYLGIDTDSVFQVEGVQKTVSIYFDVDNRYNYYKTISGNLLSYSMQCAKKSLLSLIDMKIEKIDGGTSSWVEGSESFLLDNQKGTIEYINGFYNNFFEMDVDNFPISNNGNVVYLKYSALEYKDLLNRALENSSLDKDLAKKHKALDANITEESNPIYLIGNAS